MGVARQDAMMQRRASGYIWDLHQQEVHQWTSFHDLQFAEVVWGPMPGICFVPDQEVFVFLRGSSDIDPVLLDSESLKPFSPCNRVFVSLNKLPDTTPACNLTINGKATPTQIPTGSWQHVSQRAWAQALSVPEALYGSILGLAAEQPCVAPKCCGLRVRHTGF